MATKYRALLQQLGKGLDNFQKSGSTFRVLTTIDPETLQARDVQRDEKTKTLFILDSSFNPPSIAHRSLAETALKEGNAYAGPHKLLLLFSTMNADKAPSPASFDQRLTMMAIFATDLLRKMQTEETPVVPVDIGVTTAPYYTDKSLAIEEGGLYAARPKHVHLVGYDTMTRVFTAKYYSKFEPPFSALNPYFDAGHEFRMTLRPDDGGVEEQKQLLTDLASGELQKDGGKPEWSKQVHVVPPNPRAGVSSTKVRNAAQEEDWQTVQELCTPSIAEWLQQEKLYG